MKGFEELYYQLERETKEAHDKYRRDIADHERTLRISLTDIRERQDRALKELKEQYKTYWVIRVTVQLKTGRRFGYDRGCFTTRELAELYLIPNYSDDQGHYAYEILERETSHFLDFPTQVDEPVNCVFDPIWDGLEENHF